ncbi:LysR family transcriptional regulator [Microbacteriaceae bacterium VKM Ac-2855]|nr:LysR family transcriptional regulator [Microbacteriaceae bacterium VKM Ac-2855]
MNPAAAPLDLQTLTIMRAIADSGSITAAARSLGYSQPAITQHLQRAERRLGLALVTRAGRSVRLTEAGAVLARHAVSVSASLTAAGDELALLSGVQTGRVTVAGFPTASATLVPRLLAMVRERHPGLTVRYLEAEPPEAITLLRDGGCDLAFTFSYAGDRQDPHGPRSESGFSMVDLADDEMVLAIPRTHPLAGESGPLALNGLAAEEWIGGCPLCRGHLLAACHDAGFSPTIGYETDNFVAMTAMVAAGLGMALVPQLSVRSASLPDGVVVRTVAPRIDRRIHLLAGQGRERIPAVAAVRAAALDLVLTEWSLTP